MTDQRTAQHLVFRDTIQRGLIGPGSDVFVLEDETEIIGDYPLKRYYSGVLFPVRTLGSGEPDSIGQREEEDAQVDYSDEGAEPIEPADAPGSPDDGADAPELAASPSNKELTEPHYSEATHYFPNNFGLTFCVEKHTSAVRAVFSFSRYEPVNKADGKILTGKEEFDQLVSNPIFSLKQYLEHDGTYMSFKKGIAFPFDVYSLRQQFQSDQATEIRHSPGYIKLSLLLGRLWKRTPVPPITITIPLDDSPDGSLEGIRLFADSTNDTEVTCFYKKVYQTAYGKYVKILMANSNHHPGHKYSTGNEALNKKSLFQVQIKISADHLLPYRQLTESHPFDEELNTINYQYRNERSFAVGHGCAVDWNDNHRPTELVTTFQPEADIKHFSNDFRPGFPEALKPITRLKMLSIWTPLDRGQLIEQLTAFVAEYKKWVDQQAQTLPQSEAEERIIASLLAGHCYTHERLIKNIELLATDELAYRSFLLANTAMYLQMILSRDDRFGGKVKELTDFDSSGENLYDDLAFFEHYDRTTPAYRPFQLAFLLLNLESILHPDSADRKGVVDLIWFPTGGGKTEAYLALTAFTIISRRLQWGNKAGGVSVIMRYTLRLLTAQQFDRAGKLIVSLEFLRRQLADDARYALGEEPVSIGLWVGSSTTPNTLAETHYPFNELHKAVTEKNKNKFTGDLAAKNKFPVTACPWCGCQLVSRYPSGITDYGYRLTGQSFSMACLHSRCHYRRGLPICFIDEQIYQTPPTLLFATVDKFAQLSHRPEGHKLFNSLSPDLPPPDLIIQDELHLLSGPLGSITGLYETIVELLCTRGHRVPKIIASTATTRNTAEQVKQLYGNRRLNIFPAPGLVFTDNFFSFVAESNRKHIGFFPTGKTAVDSQVQLLAHLLLARAFLYQSLLRQTDASATSAAERIDPYWTIVSFYNSLRDVGKIYNKVPAEILSLLRLLHNRYRFGLKPFEFNAHNLVARTRELTSRVASNQIKSVLDELSRPFALGKSPRGNSFVQGTIDLVLASNMFSVGIDIKRLNVLLMNGQPRNIAEYIQSSSRVGRDSKGIVINLLDANRSREKSYFENFKAFHNGYYKYVEPLSVTPFTEMTLDKALNSLLVCYVRHILGLNKDGAAKAFTGDISGLQRVLVGRISDPAQLAYAEEKLSQLARSWAYKAKDLELHYKHHEQDNHNLIKKAGMEDDWSLMQSMREIDTDSIVKLADYGH